ncbi:MAG: osmoprotectant transport system substrate-binding protein, partial [Solirubrobacteraceae bacterium]|nr:osmoprotectant transport system substrate-binding protein [Solirubrobacteraceae bacterium]
MVRALSICLALLVALVVAGCGGDDGKPNPNGEQAPVRIGTKNFTESEILGELYAQALRVKGMPVVLEPMVGSTEVINTALRDGLLDMYPEYVGVLLSEVHKVDPRPAEPQAAYALAKRLEERRDFTLLAPTRLSNENAIAVRESFARRRGVRGIPDLRRLRGNERLGVSPEFLTRFEGLVGLGRRYGLKSLKTKVVDIGAGKQYPELDDGKLAAAVVFTTDSQLAGGRYHLLEDPKRLFEAQHVAPIVSRK